MLLFVQLTKYQLLSGSCVALAPEVSLVLFPIIASPGDLRHN